MSIRPPRAPISPLLKDVQRVVEGYASGDIPVPPVTATRRTLRYAPSYRQGAAPTDQLKNAAYTARSLMQTLGITSRGQTEFLYVALSLLELVEDGLLLSRNLRNLDKQELTLRELKRLVHDVRSA